MPRILLIDDDVAVRTTLARVLVSDGHLVVTAENGREGLRALEQETIDLVITDIVMPEVDGLEFLLQLRQVESPPPVIIISGGGHGAATPYLSLARQFGAGAVLWKPVVVDELRAEIARLLG